MGEGQEAAKNPTNKHPNIQPAASQSANEQPVRSSDLFETRPSQTNINRTVWHGRRWCAGAATDTDTHTHMRMNGQTHFRNGKAPLQGKPIDRQTDNHDSKQIETSLKSWFNNFYWYFSLGNIHQIFVHQKKNDQVFMWCMTNYLTDGISTIHHYFN